MYKYKDRGDGYEPRGAFHLPPAGEHEHRHAVDDEHRHDGRLTTECLGVGAINSEGEFHSAPSRVEQQGCDCKQQHNSVDEQRANVGKSLRRHVAPWLLVPPLHEIEPEQRRSIEERSACDARCMSSSEREPDRQGAAVEKEEQNKQDTDVLKYPDSVDQP